MSSSEAGLLASACVFGAALLGGFLRRALPKEHLSQESMDAVKLAMALVATMTALVLGLLVASAKDSYDAQRSEVIQLAAKVSFLDRVLANYGQESAAARAVLRLGVERAIARIWPQDKTRHAQLDPEPSRAEPLYELIQTLSPHNDEQRALKTQALTMIAEIAQIRWLLLEQTGSAISTLLLLVVVFWLAVIFLSFGLFAPSNGTVIAALMISAFSVSCAVLLILELDRPFDGFIQISSQPMRTALQHLGQ